MAIAELALPSAPQAGALPGSRMRTVWQVDAAMPASAPTADRHALAISLHGLLDRWRGAERHLAELLADREAVSRPETSLLLDAIATYRAEHRRLFDDMRRLVSVDASTADEQEDFWQLSEIH